MISRSVPAHESRETLALPRLPFDPMPDRVEPCLALIKPQPPIGAHWTFTSVPNLVFTREWDDDLELVIIQRFDAHYDVCPFIGRLLDCTQKRRYSRSAPQFPFGTWAFTLVRSFCSVSYGAWHSCWT